MRTPLLLFTLLMVFATEASVRSESGIDPEALIERILAVEDRQRSELKDIVFDAEYIEGEYKSDNGQKENIRFVKKIYLKFFEDTVWFHEEYLECYRNGELKDEKDLRKEAATRQDNKNKRQAPDVSYPVLKPFRPDQRAMYDIEYVGVVDEMIVDHICHHFRVEAVEESNSLINGNYYFDAESFHLVRVDFSPARLVRKAIFRLSEMNISIVYGPTIEGVWVPRQFDIEGRGKTVLFFGVRFGSTEYYRNPVINQGIDESIFEVEHGS